ncbi:MAG: hypothetical protein IIZ06_07895 [Kiritimatiellae bacterium]|nr:hypothetical protein [Kiritimatiellia bacterium]
MSKSTHQVAIKGVDQTAGAFNSIAARAKATGAQIRSIMGGAIAAAGAYLSVRAVKEAVAELGKLDDIAGKTGTNVEELTQAVNGLQIIGISTSVDSLAKSLMLMQKNTGRSGMAGFYETIEELGKIPDVAERSKQAMAIFGRSGLELMPIVNAAREGTDAIKGVIGAMPGIPAAAAKAGDDANDAWSIVCAEFHSLWLQTVGAVLRFFGADMGNGMRQAAAEGMAQFEFGIKTGFVSVKMALAQIWRYTAGYIQQFLTAIGNAMGHQFLAMKEGFIDLFSGKSLKEIHDKQMWLAKEGAKAVRDGWVGTGEKLDQELRDLDEENQKRVDAWMKRRDEKMEAASKLGLNYRKVSEAMSAPDAPGGNNATPANVAEAVSRAVRVSNSLIMGGSNAERRLSVLGPTYQNEQKKQTELLKTIAKNTEKTAENTDGGEDLQVLNP